MRAALGLDCCTDHLALALLAAGDGRLLARAETPLPRGRAEALFPALRALLAEAGVEAGDLARIGVTTGPGSFTGLRVGLATATGLALGAGCPLVGMSCFEAVEAAARARLPADAPLLIALPAGRGEVGLAGSGTGLEDLAPVSVAHADLPDFLSRFALETVALAGAEAEILLRALTAAGRRPRLVEGCERPDPVRIARRALQAPTPLAPPRLLYLRPADARPSSGSGR